MAVRFRCSRCSRQIRMASFPPEGVRCPSCRVLLRRRGAPARHRPRRRYAAAAVAAAAVLIVAAIVGGITYGKGRPRPDATGEPDATEEAAAAIVPPVRVAQAPPTAGVSNPRPAAQGPAIQEPVRQEAALREPAAGRPAAPRTRLKRLDQSSEEDLRKQLLQAPVVALDAVPRTSAQLREMARKAPASDGPFAGPSLLLARRPDLQGLPLLEGADGRLGPEPAEHLAALSDKLHDLLTRETAASLRTALLTPSEALVSGGPRPRGSVWLRPEAVPCLVQVLQVEDAPIREVLVELLGKTDGPRATEALARRAITDVRPDVREAATQGLIGRPPEEYRAVLLAGLRYPWAPVASHAAETLAFVGDKGVVPELEKMLREPDPARPFTVRQGEKATTVVREMVRINHLSNCLLCHPPSSDRSGRVLGAEPTPGKSLPPRGYLGGGKGEDPPPIIRADTTFLRQDFSVMQPVPDPGQWPAYQRFDYVVRTRPATPDEVRRASETSPSAARNEAREAVLFALREITGKHYQFDGTVRAAVP